MDRVVLPLGEPWRGVTDVSPVGSFAGATIPHMARQERKILEPAVHTVAEQAAKADA